MQLITNYQAICDLIMVAGVVALWTMYAKTKRTKKDTDDVE